MKLNGDIRNAVVSENTFIAMAKPATAWVCIKLVEEEGFKINQHVVTTLVTGGSLEYKLSEERLNFEEHEAKVPPMCISLFLSHTRIHSFIHPFIHPFIHSFVSYLGTFLG